MKWWIIGFFVLQIAFDLAHSVTAFPFVHYGMFSESFAQPDSILIYRIDVDGAPLQPANFSIYRWDQVQLPLAAAVKRQESQDYAFDKDKFRSGMTAVGLSGIYNSLKANLDNHGDFTAWYKAYLGRLLGRPVGKLHIDKTWYRWKEGHMELIGTQNWLNG